MFIYADKQENSEQELQKQKNKTEKEQTSKFTDRSSCMRT